MFLFKSHIVYCFFRFFFLHVFSMFIFHTSQPGGEKITFSKQFVKFSLMWLSSLLLYGKFVDFQVFLIFVVECDIIFYSLLNDIRCIDRGQITNFECLKKNFEATNCYLMNRRLAVFSLLRLFVFDKWRLNYFPQLNISKFLLPFTFIHFSMGHCYFCEKEKTNFVYI